MQSNPLPHLEPRIYIQKVKILVLEMPSVIWHDTQFKETISKRVISNKNMHYIIECSAHKNHAQAHSSILMKPRKTLIGNFLCYIF